MITYDEMNARIVEILRISDEPDKLYAAQRIWELERDRDGWRGLATSWAKDNNRLQREAIASSSRIAELELELTERDYHKCETCEYFSESLYVCNGEWAPLRCVMNSYDGWVERSK